jgi:hypothetical protein
VDHAMSDEMGVPSWCAVSFESPTHTLFCSAFIDEKRAKMATTTKMMTTESWM